MSIGFWQIAIVVVLVVLLFVIGKISDLFGIEFLSSYVHTEGDQNGIDYLLKEVEFFT